MAERPHPPLDPLSLLRDELALATSKYIFWQTGTSPDSPSPHPLAQRQLPPSPTPAQDEWKNYPDPNLFTAWCIWYEFQWGITSPPRILDRRRELLRKVQDQEPLAPLEALWYQLIIIDTDLF